MSESSKTTVPYQGGPVLWSDCEDVFNDLQDCIEEIREKKRDPWTESVFVALKRDGEWTGGDRIDMSGVTYAVNIRECPPDVYIGRVRANPDGSALEARGVAPVPKRGCFGNPLQIDFKALRTMPPADARAYLDGVMAGYRAYFTTRVEEDAEFRAAVLRLRGKRLGCFCKPGPCHGDVIAAWVNAQSVVEARS